MNKGENIKNLTEISSFAKSMTKIGYDSEVRREDSLIQQASQMQAAFSFTTAALFMATPVMFEYRGILSFCYIYVVVSSITAVLLFSLFAATMAQNRMNRAVFSNGKSIIKYIEENEESFKDESSRNKYTAELYAEIEESLIKTNDERVFWIQWSMRAFYTAIAGSILWFVIALGQILCR